MFFTVPCYRLKDTSRHSLIAAGVIHSYASINWAHITSDERFFISSVYQAQAGRGQPKTHTIMHSFQYHIANAKMLHASGKSVKSFCSCVYGLFCFDYSLHFGSSFVFVNTLYHTKTKLSIVNCNHF